MERENLFMSTVISMTDNGLMIKLMVMESTSMQMELNKMESGRMIFSVAMESKLRQTSQSMKVSINSEKNTESEAINGMMDQCTTDIGRRTKYQALVFIPGSMDGVTRVNGLTIIWKALEFTNGMTTKCTKANTRTIKNMALESSPMLTTEAMKATGTWASSTESALMLVLKIVK